MPVVMKGNLIFVKSGDKAFKVASNFTNYLELGVRGITDYYLEARVESDGFVVDATLRDSLGHDVCRVERNVPSDQGCIRELTPYGYRIKTMNQQALLELIAPANVCSIKAKIYDGKGSLVAEDKGDDFLIYRGPAVLGKSGNARGMVIS
jgi:hypothetical protein